MSKLCDCSTCSAKSRNFDKHFSAEKKCTKCGGTVTNDGPHKLYVERGQQTNTQRNMRGYIWTASHGWSSCNDCGEFHNMIQTRGDF